MSYRTIKLTNAGTRDPSLPVDLPYVDNFLASIRYLSEMGKDRRVTRYLREVLTKGHFEVVSPLSGRLLSSGTSVVLHDKSVFFGFPEERDFFVGVDNLASGFPMSSALILSKKLLLTTGNSTWGINEKSVDLLADNIARSGWEVSASVEPPILISGDANFAHHAWNQLSCLLELLSSSVSFSILSTHEPLGPLTEILPELREISIERCPASWITRANRPGRTFVPLGSTLLSTDLVNRLVVHAYRNLSGMANSIAVRLENQDRKKFWVSIRTRNRTITNQTVLLETIGKEIFRVFPNSIIVLDGHSVQCDLHSNSGSYNIAQAEDIVAADELVASELHHALASHGEVISAVGLSITDSIFLARLCNFYFCHHGTIQHKIGWFSSIPGMVHCNQRTLALKPANWARSQSELAVMPAYIPEQCVYDAVNSAEYDQQRIDLRLDNYSIPDTYGVSMFFTEYARRLLS